MILSNGPKNGHLAPVVVCEYRQFSVDVSVENEGNVLEENNFIPVHTVFKEPVIGVTSARITTKHYAAEDGEFLAYVNQLMYATL